MASLHMQLFPIVVTALIGTVWSRALDIKTQTVPNYHHVISIEKRKEIKTEQSSEWKDIKMNPNLMAQFQDSLWAASPWMKPLPNLLTHLTRNSLGDQGLKAQTKNCTATSRLGCPGKDLPTTAPSFQHAKRVVFKFLRIGRSEGEVDKSNSSIKNHSRDNDDIMMNQSNENTPIQLDDVKDGNETILQQKPETTEMSKPEAVPSGSSKDSKTGSVQKWMEEVRKRMGRVRIGKLPARLFFRHWNVKPNQLGIISSDVPNEPSLAVTNPRDLIMNNLPRYG